MESNKEKKEQQNYGEYTVDYIWREDFRRKSCEWIKNKMEKYFVVCIHCSMRKKK